MNRTGIRFTHAEWVNILEEPMSGDETHCSYQQEDGKTKVNLNMRHFEIKTLRLFCVV